MFFRIHKRRLLRSQRSEFCILCLKKAVRSAHKKWVASN